MSNINEINDYIRMNLKTFLETITVKSKGTNLYVCPFCGSGTKKNKTGALSYTEKSGVPRVTCFSQNCVVNGDTFDLISKYYNIDIGASFKKAYEIFGFSNGVKNEKISSSGDLKKELKNYLADCHKRISSTTYLTDIRKLNDDTILKFNLGFDPNYTFKSKSGKMVQLGAAIIIPYSDDNNYFVARLLEPPNWFNANYVKPNSKDFGDEPVFNLEALYNDDNMPVFVTESPFCAMSIVQVGGQAISIGGVGYTKLINQLMKRKTDNFIILSLDNDEAGRKTSAKLLQELKTIDITCCIKNISGNFKDPNESLQNGESNFRKSVNGVIRGLSSQQGDDSKPDSIKSYLQSAFLYDINRFKTFSNKKSGFSNLDLEMGGLYSGLYVLGGISSVGKTTFVHQLADQLAYYGEHILFFSLEQSKLELISKSLSRETAKIDMNQAVTALDIRSGNIRENVESVINRYMDIADRISIIQGDYYTSVESIDEYVCNYIRKNNVKPTVIIDYLQIIQSEQKSAKREQIDLVVTELKRISRRYDIIVLVISSLNRSNYLTPIDFESFKESGGIEYTADVIWGLQLFNIHDDIFIRDGKINEKREKIKLAKMDSPRKIELIGLKNRNGKPIFSCLFDYYPQFDLFVENIKNESLDIVRL